TGNGREFCSAGAEGETLPKSGKKEAATLRVTATFKSLTDKHYATAPVFLCLLCLKPLIAQPELPDT
ncbi:hypothetical protein, partial [Pectobacterium versatile]|uniref:hypothetical protein n=1 Tax=Pectobacterium versatile TaxID=2488639 RepID=UPI00208F43B3